MLTFYLLRGLFLVILSLCSSSTPNSSEIQLIRFIREVESVPLKTKSVELLEHPLSVAYKSLGRKLLLVYKEKVRSPLSPIIFPWHGSFFLFMSKSFKTRTSQVKSQEGFLCNAQWLTPYFKWNFLKFSVLSSEERKCCFFLTSDSLEKAVRNQWWGEGWRDDVLNGDVTMFQRCIITHLKFWIQGL